MTETESSSEPTIAERLRFVATTRNVPYDLLCSALEEALGAAYRRHYGSTSAVVAFDRGTGAYTIFERRLVVDAVEYPLTEVALSAAAGYELGDFVDRPVEPKGFSRLAGLEAQRVLELLEAQHASAAAAPVDPEMVAKLEAFAREREAAARELPSDGPSCDTVRP